MKLRSAFAALLVVASLLPGSIRAAAPVDPVRELADSGYPAISSLVTNLARSKWAERVDELIKGAPVARNMGPAWKKGDPHWDAAHDGIMEAVDEWAKNLLAAQQAKDLVYQGFAKGIDAPNAEAIMVSLGAAETKEFPELCDRMHLGVIFAAERKDLEIDSPEFKKAYAAWISSLQLPTGAPKPTPELTKLMQSESGKAYATARGFAIDSLLSGLEGQVQLRFYNAQQLILAEVIEKAQECGKADHSKQ